MHRLFYRLSGRAIGVSGRDLRPTLRVDPESCVARGRRRYPLLEGYRVAQVDRLPHQCAGRSSLFKVEQNDHDAHRGRLRRELHSPLSNVIKSMALMHTMTATYQGVLPLGSHALDAS